MSNNEANPEETLVPASDADSDDTFNPFDDFNDAYSPGTILKVTASDGLPTQVVPETDSDIPVLSTKTLICMGDFSQFFGTWEGGHHLRFEPDAVEQLFDGRYVLKDNPAKVVVPKRQPCAHYARQVTQLEANPQAREHVRLCTARRTTTGAFMTVANVAMWACTMREPRDFESERECIDAFDKQKMQQGAEREYGSIFGPVRKEVK